MPRPALRTLRAKLVAVLVPLVVVGVGAMTVLSISRATQAQRSSAHRELQQRAAALANRFDGEARQTAAIGHTIAAEMIDTTDQTRAGVDDSLHRVLLANPRVAGVYVGFERDAFDGADAAHRHDPSDMGAGRFGPYWNRLSGKVRLEPLVDADTSDYYTLPKRTGRDAVIEPYIYQGALMTSYISPIMRDGRFAGIAGADVLLDRLQQETARERILKSGYALAVSRRGVIAGAPEAQKALLGKRSLAQLAATRKDAALAHIADEVRAGRSGVVEAPDPFTGRPSTIAYASTSYGHWAMLTIAPTSEVLASVHRLRTALIVAGLIICLLVAVAVVVTATRVTAPLAGFVARLRSLSERDLSDLRAGIEAVADGDLTHEARSATEPANDRSTDEIGQASRTLDELVETTRASVEAYNSSRAALATMIGRVAETAGSVSSASQQMAGSSEEAGRAVGEIAHAIEEVAAGSQRQVQGVEEARSLTLDVVDATNRATTDAAATAEAADEARRIAAEGTRAAADASQAMTSVRSASGDATAAIRELGDKSEEIGGIVATITGIAEQTNLLALNAAIEAARAGDQGRGFAVVADEVRKLAEESQQAARSISALIADMQAETGRAVAIVEEGATLTARGTTTVEEARDAFERIDAAVQDVTARVGQIAAAVGEISSSAKDTGDRIADVAAVAEQTSASSEEVSASTEQTSASTQEIAASAGELARSASDLEALVARFRLG